MSKYNLSKLFFIISFLFFVGMIAWDYYALYQLEKSVDSLSQSISRLEKSLEVK